MPQIALLLLLVGVAYYFGWWPFDETARAVQNAEFNVYFYDADGRQQFVGEVAGLEACRTEARHYARQLGQAEETRWSYVCCRKTRTERCASKHQ
ncbi:MAG: hypothetical protein P8106_04815 [Gammaproteobacteria bacterium]|jgi:hypothetical protein